MNLDFKLKSKKWFNPLQITTTIAAELQPRTGMKQTSIVGGVKAIIVRIRLILVEDMIFLCCIKSLNNFDFQRVLAIRLKSPTKRQAVQPLIRVAKNGMPLTKPSLMSWKSWTSLKYFGSISMTTNISTAAKF